MVPNHFLTGIKLRTEQPPITDIVIQTSDTPVDKVDDLAIIFHQHQPYYKNKLTGGGNAMGSRAWND